MFKVLCFLIVILSFFPAFSYHLLTTPTLIESATLALHQCASYRIVGACTWLECGWGGCNQNNTPRVRHYVPEFVVLAYPEYAEIPWKEYALFQKTIENPARRAYQAKQGLSLSDGHLEGERTTLQETMLFESSVVGHPALITLPPGFLKGRAKAFFPYFNSLLDSISWRGGEALEISPPQYALSLTRNTVGPLLTPFGSVYPRTGFVMQTEPAKAAATVAVRALNIVSGIFFPHIAAILTRCPYEQCEIPPTIEGLGEKTRYQQLLPVSSLKCEASYPHINLDLNTEVYAWAVWREYTACIPGRGQFLWSV